MSDLTEPDAREDFVLLSERRIREVLSGDRLEAFDSLRDRARHLWDEYQRLAGENLRLREALAPFAAIVERLHEACWEPDEEMVLVSLEQMTAQGWELPADLSMTDFDRAAAALLEGDA